MLASITVAKIGQFVFLEAKCSRTAAVRPPYRPQKTSMITGISPGIGTASELAEMPSKSGLPRFLARRSTPPPRQPEQQEGSDLYSGVVFLADDGRLRVAVCRKGRRWLIQRRAPLEHPPCHPWTSVSFCTTGAGLEIAAASPEYRGVVGLAVFAAKCPVIAKAYVMLARGADCEKEMAPCLQIAQRVLPSGAGRDSYVRRAQSWVRPSSDG